ncbi:MAG: hypothetical protein JSV22_06615 [Bacteroidales bacterium]|nr:MAG: hypothetical protein JSV22_06615 [Bacteroidales bacterium]
MQKYVLIPIIISLLFSLANGNPVEKPRKQYSLEAGYNHIIYSGFDYEATSGVSALLDYAWNLSGPNQKKNVYLSVPLGYTYLFADDKFNGRNIKILTYGWTVRHELRKDKVIIPFIGYALLLNQLSIDEIDGSIFGHHTKFETGINMIKTSKIQFLIKIEYSLTRYPSLGSKNSNWMHSFGIKTGIRL